MDRNTNIDYVIESIKIISFNSLSKLYERSDIFHAKLDAHKLFNCMRDVHTDINSRFGKYSSS